MYKLSTQVSGAPFGRRTTQKRREMWKHVYDGQVGQDDILAPLCDKVKDATRHALGDINMHQNCHEGKSALVCETARLI